MGCDTSQVMRLELRDMSKAQFVRPLAHAEMVAIWYRLRNAEYRYKIQSEMNYQLGGAGEMRTEKGWQQPEPHQIDWEKLANFLNDMYERIGLGRNTSAEALELEHINGKYR